MRALWVAVWCALAVLLLPGVALADGAGGKVVLGKIDGPHASRVRRNAVRALKKVDGVELVDEYGADAAAATAKAADADAKLVLTGTVTRGKPWKVEFRPVSVGDGKSLDAIVIDGPNLFVLERKVQKSLGEAIAPALSAAVSPSEQKAADAAAAAAKSKEPAREPEEPKQKAPKKQEQPKSDEPDEADVAGAISALELRAGMVGFHRIVRFQDDLFDALPDYDLPLGPAARAELTWYPAAHFTSGAAAWFGIDAAYERAFLVESETETGEALGTDVSQWHAGLRVRAPLSSMEPSLLVAYGADDFVIDDAETGPALPSTQYRFIHAGLDVLLRLGGPFVGFGGAYRLVSEAGDIEDDIWFPRADAGGVVATLFGGIELSESFELRAGVRWQRYFYTLNPEPGDTSVAGGSVDERFAGFLLAGWRLAGAP